MPSDRQIVLRPADVPSELRSVLPHPGVFREGSDNRITEVKLTDPVFTLSESLPAIGAPMPTIQKYFRQFAWMPHLRSGRGKQTMISAQDLLLMSLGIRLVRGGIPASKVGWLLGGPGVWGRVVKVLFDRAQPSVVLAHEGGSIAAPDDKMTVYVLDPGEPVGKMIERMKRASLRDQFIVFDLRDVISHVERAMSIEFVRKSK